MDDQRIELPEERSRTKTLLIDSPLIETLDVVVVPAGNFGKEQLARVLVALRYTDDENDYVVDENIILAKQSDTGTWSVPLMNKDLRDYEYQLKVIYADGVVRETDWARTDTTILVVGDPFSTRVRIMPNLLNIPPGRFAFGTIHLSFSDPHDPEVQSETTLSLESFTKPLEWRFRLADPNRRTFRYQLTLFDAEGKEYALPESTEDKEVLVLKPPPAEPG